jgi:hypothetical protein
MTFEMVTRDGQTIRIANPIPRVTRPRSRTKGAETMSVLTKAPKSDARDELASRRAKIAELEVCHTEQVAEEARADGRHKGEIARVEELELQHLVGDCDEQSLTLARDRCRTAEDAAKRTKAERIMTERVLDRLRAEMLPYEVAALRAEHADLWRRYREALSREIETGEAYRSAVAARGALFREAEGRFSLHDPARRSSGIGVNAGLPGLGWHEDMIAAWLEQSREALAVLGQGK